jgi:DNA-binding CsgD family transcriptional regulator
VKLVRKPSGRRKRAIVVLSPVQVEAVRQALIGSDRAGDATLVSVLAYAGLRPQEALASLRIREGASIPELAEELGHSPHMTLNTYSHVIRELRGTPTASAENEVLTARTTARGALNLEARGPSVDHQTPR